VTGPGTEPAAPVPVAVLARTSTLYLQDPLASLQRQYRSCEEWLPEGWYVAGFYWDVESGAIDIEDRSQTASHEQFTAAGPDLRKPVSRVSADVGVLFARSAA
jgi:hypothetical protein